MLKKCQSCGQFLPFERQARKVRFNGKKAMMKYIRAKMGQIDLSDPESPVYSTGFVDPTNEWKADDPRWSGVHA